MQFFWELRLEKAIVPLFRTIRNLYAHCVQSEEGQHVGCITDKMGDGSYLTVPVYATLCSAMCYESKANMERVKKCPYPGFRKHDPRLSKLFRWKETPDTSLNRGHYFEFRNRMYDRPVKAVMQAKYIDLEVLNFSFY